MDFLPENCRVCKDGKYKLKEFNYRKATDYLKSIGRTLHTYELYYNYCISAVYYARQNNEDPEQFYEINEYTCPYKDECKFAKI